LTEVNSLVIDGTVYFEDSDTGPDEYVLKAKWIWIKGGVLRAGSADKPFSKKIKIILTGGKESEFFVIDDFVEPANKSIGVTGSL
jgi:hypothetical protein